MAFSCRCIPIMFLVSFSDQITLDSFSDPMIFPVNAFPIMVLPPDNEVDVFNHVCHSFCESVHRALNIAISLHKGTPNPPPPRHVQTCSTWTSLYRVQPPEMCLKNLCNTDFTTQETPTQMFKLVHHVACASVHRQVVD